MKPLRRFHLLALFLGLLSICSCALPAYANSGNTAGFTVTTFNIPGIVLAAAAGDMDGDNAADLLLFHKPEKLSYDKVCSVFFQRDGQYRLQPNLQIPLGKSVSAFCVNDIDSDGSDELCGFDGEGMVLFAASASDPVVRKRLIECRTVLPPTSRHCAIVDWAADLGSDGTVDIFLPVAEGIRSFTVAKDMSVTPAHAFEFPVRGSVREEGGQSYITYRLPKLDFSDFDKDGHTDLGVFDLERMDFFLSNSSGTAARHIQAQLLRELTKDFVGGTYFDDLNGDGIPDAVLVLLSQRKNLQSEVQIYFGNKNFFYGDQPTHVYSGDANLILPVFFDATGDGKQEMLLQKIDVGIGFFLNYFLANRIRVETEIYRISPEGKYEGKALASRPIYIQASESGVEPARGAGDFNGDGL
ncbi:MAG: VCBS repeat-containing protein, partial [Candidatus Abyssobacteria bacterium SURF_17]